MRRGDFLGFLAGAALAIAAGVYCLRGLVQAVSPGGSYDLSLRAWEFRLFMEGVYPHAAVASNALAGESFPNSVYPPYAFPLFSPFFISGTQTGAILTLLLASLLSLGVIAAYGHRSLHFAGGRAQDVGAMAALAIAHNFSALALGQFSLVCMGMIALQLHFLSQGRRYAAGLCWALAMVKPQIAIAFLVLFLYRRQWQGLVFALLLLASLGWFACLRTGVPLQEVASYWLAHGQPDFLRLEGNPGSSVGWLISQEAIDSQILLFLGVAACAGVCFAAWRRARADHWSILTLAAVCAIAGRVFIPHRAYDNIMLFPALLALVVLAYRLRTPAHLAWASFFGLSLWLPWTSLFRSPLLDAGLLAFWSATAVFLVRHAVMETRPGSFDSRHFSAQAP